MRDFGINWDAASRKTELNPEAIVDSDVLHIPIMRKYQLQPRIVEKETKDSIFDKFPVRGYFSSANVKTKFIKPFHDTQDLAIQEFLLEENSDPWIVALFEAPQIVDFSIDEFRTVQIFNDPHNTITLSVTSVRSGEDLKKEFTNNPRFREVYEEILRERTKVDRALKEEAEQRERDKRESFYHQWKWLERKREAGEFEDFMIKETEQ
jgi:hypothetical protein